MDVLGIHDGHSASVALVRDGRVVAAVQEERLTRNKNQGGFPERAMADVLEQAGLSLNQLDAVAFSGFGISKVRTREDILTNYLRCVEPERTGTLKQVELFLRNLRPEAPRRRRREEKQNRRLRERCAPVLDRGVPWEKIHFVEHHRCHATTAYFGGGLPAADEVLVITCDAAGDGKCATVSIGKNGTLTPLAEVPDTASAAFIYSMFTFLMGFVPLEHEYKLMGLAPYTRGSAYVDQIADYLMSLYEFPPDRPLVWGTAAATPDILKLGPVFRDYVERKRFDNLAGGLQLFVERFMIKWIRRVLQETGLRRVALSGGIFMNVKLNKLILELPEVDSLFVFPSCGDESNCFGAAWAAYRDVVAAAGGAPEVVPLGPVYLGRAFTDADAAAALSEFQFEKRVRVTRVDDIERRVAELLAGGEVVARCKGRMEFGARALGNRSILANPSKWGAVKVINEMIKMRDFWMPFAPSILAECADDYMLNPKQVEAPYMILAFDSKPEKIERFVAATHPYDESCRPQVVSKAWNPDYHHLIDCYREQTGEGVVLNTSFNLHGYPIVYSPGDALHVFDKSGLRFLALENHLVEEVRA